MSIDYEFHAPGDPERTTGVLEIVTNRLGTRSLEGLRVLDLACRTGAFSRTFSGAGAEVVGIEGKLENFHRIPETERTTFLNEDVRNLSRDRHGLFDITLCLGILYHLDANDAIQLLNAIHDVTTNFCVIDTHVGAPTTTVTVKGSQYQGSWYHEGVPGPWSSLGNSRSFWFTPSSLIDACYSVGWSDVEVLPGIRWPGEPAGRHWMIIS